MTSNRTGKPPLTLVAGGRDADEASPPGAVKSARGPNGYSATTRDINVTVKPIFLEDQSSPPDNHYVWAYHVRIENHGKASVQLRNRHWVITDAIGRIQEVRGAGVVGE